jgi:phosphoglycolate phosphatase-like HAD superfamily hydrolase
MGEKRIDTVVWDADNTLWDWVAMHLSGMRAMSGEISSLIGIPESAVKESMKRVYGKAKTFDYEPLDDEMDVINEWAENISDKSELAAKAMPLFYATHSVHTYDHYKRTFRLYEGVEDVLSNLCDAGVLNIIMSDAPLSFIIRRLKHCGIDKYFSAIYGQPEQIPIYKMAYEMADGELDYYKKIRRKIGFCMDTAVFQLNNERKPDISFAEKFGKTPDEVSQTVAMVGDNVGKDMGLAHNNNCLGIYAGYGMADAESIAGLYEYGPPDVVTRNASIINCNNLKMIKQMGEKIVVVEKCREILQHVLGAK